MKLAIISGKGGTGKSSITSAFVSLAKKALTIDCDVDAANLYLIFQPDIEKELPFISAQQAVVDADKCTGCGLCEMNCHFNAIHLVEGIATIDEVACEGCQLCSHLCPQEAIHMEDAHPSRIYEGNFRFGRMVYGRLAPGEENSGKLISHLREYADQVMQKEGYELAILDGPPGIGCPVISTITGIDKIVLVTEPSLSGMSDLKRVHQLAKGFCSSVDVIINKFDLDQDICQQIETWCKQQETPIIAHVPFDKDMVKAQLEAQSIVEYRPEGEITHELRKAYQQLNL